MTRPSVTLPTLALPASALLLVLALFWHGPIPQWASYHQFADQRHWASMPNALNVWSNLPFALVGIWGCIKVQRLSLAWRGFALAIMLTAAGSAVYHWQPNNLTLTLDRWPIAVACALLTCAFLGERIGQAWDRAFCVGLATLLASAAVIGWYWGERAGAGDLRLYLLVQFLPLLLVPVALCTGTRALHPRTATPASAWWWALALYVAAKGLELADQPVMALGQLVSGHTLKHLLAATAAGVLLARAGTGSGTGTGGVSPHDADQLR